ncbi:MAG: TonB-dependent receptor [Bacteroidales bacterium]|nr:TonB-dependent receptor [Bacteroidales bacterium]
MKLRLFILMCVSALSAEAVEMTDSVYALDEVSVTAIKTGGELLYAPVAVTVVDADEARRLGIVSMKNVSALSPNLYIPEYGSRMTSSIYMRGIGARIDQPAVGLNVDNVPFLNKDAFDFDITDIERIEVLRGPQSAMYGRNTMAGLINITTTSPLRFQGVRILAEAATGNSYRGAVSGFFKISRRLGMSISGQYNCFGGYVTNMYDGTKADASRDLSLRWKTEWRPVSELKIENTAAFGRSHQPGYPYAFEETGEVNYNDPCFYKRLTFTDGLTVKWDAEKFSLSSITSYQYIDDNMTLDQDFLPLDYFTLSQIRTEHSVTEEIVARGLNNSEGYNWTAGVFGFTKQGRMNAPVTFKSVGIDRLITGHVNENNPTYPITWESDEFLLGSRFRIPVNGVSVYHRSSYTTGPWSFAGVLRLDYEHTALRYHSFTSTGYIVNNLTDPEHPTIYSHEKIDIDDRGRLSRNFVSLLPSFTATYHSGAHEAYASVAKGYKAGGYNTQMFSDVLQQRLMAHMGVAEKYDVDEIVAYKPEKSWNYEAGYKLRLPEYGFDLSTAVFYIDCRDQQLTTFPDGTTTGRIMTNAGRTESYGVEVSARYSPLSRWNFNAAYGYTHAQFRRFHNGLADYSGNYVPYAPSNTLYLSAMYTLPIGLSWIDALSFDVNYRGIGRIYWDEDNSSSQPFYGRLGAIISASGKHGSIEISAENITGTKYDTFRYVSIGNNFFQRDRPASCRVTLRILI